MAIGPRLELRQSQSLVMTPQLRQAIKLLQFSNLEVAAFVEEELERNPLLERDEAAEDAPTRSARRSTSSRPAAAGDSADLAARRDLARTPPRIRSMPVHAESYDPGGVADGGPGRGERRRRAGFQHRRARHRGRWPPRRPSLREHLGEQLRLTFADPADRLIGAHLIALLCPAGRLTADAGGDRRRRWACRSNGWRRCARAMLRFDPTGLFARDLKECLAAQLAERNRLDPAMATLLDNLDLLARRDTRRLMAMCGVDADDLAEMVAETPRARPEARRWTFDVAPRCRR